MRKILFAVPLLFMFLACETDQNEQKQEEYKKEVKGVGGGAIIIDIGRPSKQCHGFGACTMKIVVVIIHRVPLQYQEQKTATAQITEDGKFAILELGAPASTFTDLDFIIEETLFDKATKIGISKGKYTLDKTIGEFGGYKLSLTK